MPTYQYACTECGDGFEQFQSFSDEALTECPTCGGRLRKVFNSVGIVFKGSGFYRNDSREAAKGTGKDGTSKDKESVGSAKADSSSGSSGGAKSSDGSSDKRGGGSDKKSERPSSAGSPSGKGGSSSSGGSSAGSSSTTGSAA